MARALLLKRPSPFAFPGGNPGFDPNHVASSNVRFSAVAAGASFRSLLNGAGGTPTGTVAALDGAIGPCVTFRDSTSDAVNFSGTAQALPSSCTMAAIFNVAFTNSFNGIVSTGNGSWCLCQRGNFEIFNGNTEVSSGIGVGNGPTLFIGSANASTVNFLVKRLDTGTVITASIAGSAATGTEGNYSIGNFTGGNAFSGSIATAMYAANFMSLPQMLQWAQDPWGFWYPRTFDISMLLTAPSVVVVSPAVQGILGLAACEW